MTTVPPSLPTFTLSQRTKRIIGALVVPVVLFTAIGTMTDIYVDYLWFDSTHYTEVFWTQVRSRALLFAVAGVATGGAIGLAGYLAHRYRPAFLPSTVEQRNLEQYRRSIEPRRTFWLAVAAGVPGVIAGLVVQGRWETWLEFRNATSFGTTDPQFHKDLSFFVFDYPFYRLALGLGLSIVLLALICSLLTHYLYGGLRLRTPGRRLTGAARVQLSVLLGLFVALKAVAYWFDRYGLVYSDRGKVFTGAGYTDVHALLVPKGILVAVAVICALAFFANILFRNFLLPAAALVLMLMSSLVIGVAYPAIVQQFVVNPSADQKEAPYIQRAISSTLAAYGLSDVQYVDYAQNTTGNSVDPAAARAAVEQDAQTISNVRLLDPNVLSATFTAQQQIRNVYGFPQKLDIDRYTIDGHEQEDVVAVRELDTAGLSGNQNSWINQQTVYTHGNGFVAAPANQVVAGAAGGSPNVTTGNLPTTGPIQVTADGARIYYGELVDGYSVVGAPDGTAPREFDRPQAGSDTGQVNSTYHGPGGVSVGSFLRRLAFAIQYRDRNFLLSGAVNDRSRVLYVRDPRQRIEKVAPFLQVDGDPYPAVIDGRVTWILDGYTTSDAYPYAERMQLGQAVQDSRTGAGTTALPNDQINYVRNSVKATVDAYDGTVTLYAWDEHDPVLKTYEKAYPGLLQPRSAMSQDLISHVRYPEDLFKLQREVLTRYHVTDPGDFYDQNNRWQVPDDPTQNTSDPQPPYYLLAQRPGDSSASFQLTSALNAYGRENLSAFMSADCDPQHYGQIQVLQLPGNTPFRGPQQVQQSFITNNQVRPDLTLYDSQNSRAVFGNLLTLPIGASGLLYVEPLYVQGTGNNSFPLLQKVLVDYGDQVGYADTLAQALDQVFGAGTGQAAPAHGSGTSTSGSSPPASSTATPSPSTSTSPPAGGSPTDPQLDRAVGAIDAALTALADAQKSGDFAAIGQAEADLQKAVKAYETAKANASPSG